MEREVYRKGGKEGGGRKGGRYKSTSSAPPMS